MAHAGHGQRDRGQKDGGKNGNDKGVHGFNGVGFGD